MAGKLNGEMMPTTPSGCRVECTSTFVEAFSVKPPLIKCGMPQANSTTSWPRLTSPSASESTLPCSEVMIAASSFFRAFSSSRKAKRIWVRLVREVSRHFGNAAERRGDDFIDVVLRSERELCGDLTGGRIGHVGEAPAVALEDLAGLPVVERRCHGCSYLMMLLSAA